jgi:hypothetical protein
MASPCAAAPSRWAPRTSRTRCAPAVCTALGAGCAARVWLAGARVLPA